GAICASTRDVRAMRPTIEVVRKDQRTCAFFVQPLTAVEGIVPGSSFLFGPNWVCFSERSRAPAGCYPGGFEALCRGSRANWTGIRGPTIDLQGIAKATVHKKKLEAAVEVLYYGIERKIT